MRGKGDRTTNILLNCLIGTTKSVQETEKQISDVAMPIKFTTTSNEKLRALSKAIPFTDASERSSEFKLAKAVSTKGCEASIDPGILKPEAVQLSH